LQVAAGEAGDGAVEQLVDPQDARRFLDPATDLGARDALAGQRESDVAAYVHVRVEREKLEDEGDVAPRRPPEGDVLAVQKDQTGCRQFQPGDHPQRRRLAAAAWSEHDEELAVLDREGRILDGDEVVESFVEVLDADPRHGRRPSIRKLGDDHEHHGPRQGGRERPGIECQRQGLHQHRDAAGDQRDGGAFPGASSE